MISAVRNNLYVAIRHIFENNRKTIGIANPILLVWGFTLYIIFIIMVDKIQTVSQRFKPQLHVPL